MRKYELMTIFPVEDDLSKNAQDAVRAVLAQCGAEIESEQPFGDRDLCYEVKKRTKGRYILFNIKVNPAKLVEIEKQFKLQADLLKYMFVRIDE